MNNFRHQNNAVIGQVKGEPAPHATGPQTFHQLIQKNAQHVLNIGLGAGVLFGYLISLRLLRL